MSSGESKNGTTAIKMHSPDDNYMLSTRNQIKSKTKTQDETLCLLETEPNRTGVKSVNTLNDSREVTYKSWIHSVWSWVTTLARLPWFDHELLPLVQTISNFLFLIYLNKELYSQASKYTFQIWNSNWLLNVNCTTGQGVHYSQWISRVIFGLLTSFHNFPNLSVSAYNIPYWQYLTLSWNIGGSKWGLLPSSVVNVTIWESNESCVQWDAQT